MKVRVFQPGQPPIAVDVPGDVATLGRSAACDVVIRQPHVTKRHVKLMRGLVAIDLGSSNGTFIGNERIEEPALVVDGRLRLGPGDIEIEVEIGAADSGASALLQQRIRDVEARNAFLEQEAIARANQPLVPPPEPVPDPELGRLQGDNHDLRRRLDSLKGEIEARDVGASAELQARLATEQLQGLQRENERLSVRERELERTNEELSLNIQKFRAGVHGADTASAQEVAELQRQLQSKQSELDALGKQPAAVPASVMFVQLQESNAALKQRIKELEESGASTAEAPANPLATEMYYRLQIENAELKRKLAQPEASAAPAAPVVGDSRSMRIRELERELEHTRAEVAKAQSRTSSTPVSEAAASGSVQRVLQTLIDGDIEALDGSRQASTLEEFFVAESVCFLRNAERIVTRMAGSFIQLYQLNTMLPDMQGNLRGLVAGALHAPDDQSARQDLGDYVEELGKWLVVSLGAYKKAAERFAEQLKSDLSEPRLTGDKPVSGLRKLTGQGEAELWRRTSAYLGELTPDVIDERIEKLAREVATEMLDTGRD